jgi:septum formation protein
LQVILASTSKTRHSLLANAGVAFTSVDSEVDEQQFKKNLPDSTPKSLALALAEAKAKAVSKRHPGQFVVGADQTLGLGNSLFDKPKSLAEARGQLEKLRGETHKLFSAVACVLDNMVIWSCCSEAKLTMRNFSSAFFEDYLKSIADTYSHSVGGYRLEERGITLFDKIEGDYFTILGLPLLPLLAFLRERRIIPA